MTLNAAVLLLAAALDHEVSKTFMAASAAAEDSGAGVPVYHAKHALVKLPSADADNATAAAGANATASSGANATAAANATASVNATAAKLEADAGATLAVDAAAAAAANHPDVVTHKKAAGGGYLKGSPLYAGGNATRAGAKGKSKFTDDNFPKVSHTMSCVIELASQYFIIYSMLAIVNSYNEFSLKPFTQMARILESAKDTVNFAPMLSVLFLGVRMRALQLTQGDPDAYGLPQDFTKTGMTMATVSVLCQTVLVIVIPLTLGGTPQMGDDGMPVITGGDMVAKALIVLRWVLMVCLYGGFTTVCYGAFAMEAPKEVYPGGAPPVSPAVGCTMNLCLQYFLIYLAVALINTYVQFQPRDITFWTAKLKVTLNLAKNTVNFAPMLCVLFIGARMRALQLDPVAGNPQAWAQNCMYLCAYAVLCQLVFVIAIPLLLGGHVLGNKDLEGDVAFEVENPTLFWVMNCVRYLIMLAMYGGAIAVIVSVCTIEAIDGPTPPVSPAMACTINLTIQFFLVYAYLWVLLTLRQADLPERAGALVKEMLPTAMSATKTVQFCPMLSVLFIGMRLRALQLSNQQGSPQGFVQDAMFLCTYALLLQLVMVFLLPLFQSSSMKYNQQTGLAEATRDSPVAWGVTLAIRYLALLFLYGGACTIVYGLFTITPSTANGSGDLVPGLAIDPPPTPA